MPSLLRQSHKNFSVWICCDPAEPSENEELSKTLADPRFQIITNWRNQVAELCFKGDPNDPLIFCRMDSDDMYGKRLIQTFNEKSIKVLDSGKNFLQPQSGYAYQILNRKIYRWENPSPAFFAVVMRRNQAERMARGPALYHHGHVREKALILNHEPMFCVTLHDVNICNLPRVSWLGEEITDSELETVRAEYGIAA